MVAKRESSIDPGESQHHSYEDFTNRPFYVDVNRKTVSLIPRSRHIVDIATGTGAVVSQLLEQDKFSENFWLTGFDLDDSALQEAERKFENVEGGIIEFEHSPAEKLPIPDNQIDVVTFCNAIHLTDAPNALKEAFRILKPGGMLALNTAYANDIAYAPDAEHPGGSKKTWGILAVLARKIAKEKYGIEIPKEDRPSRDVFKYSLQDYRQMAEDAGFKNISIGRIKVRMSKEDLEAICRYKEFAEGTLPGVAYETAKDCLLQSVTNLIESRKETDNIAREWMILYAFKDGSEFPKVAGI